MNYNAIIDIFYPADKNPELRDILLTHSRGVADLALEIVNNHPEFNVNAKDVEAAAMLHDIGICRCDAEGIKCYGTEPYICHGRLGAEMIRSLARNDEEHGLHCTAEELEPYARVCERHTGAGLSKHDIEKQGLPLPHQDFLPETEIELIVCFADKFYSKTRPEVRKTLEQAERSIAKFGEEGLASFKEWERIFL